jgi:TonB family protein
MKLAEALRSRCTGAFPLGGMIFLAAPLLIGCGGEDEMEGPTPLYGEIPIEYPLDLWDADVEGETILRVRVTEMGTVDSVEVIQGSGYPAFDSAAVRGALQLQYSPARRRGERIAVWARVPVQFTKDNP